MTLDEFETALKQLQPGDGAEVPYAIFEELFPPGEPDQQARGRAHDFAQAHGCQIENHREERVVVFYRPALDDVPF